jgi:hypothetical protein
MIRLQVDDDAAVARRIAGETMQRAIIAVGHVEHAVPDTPGLFVNVESGQHDVTAQAGCERLDRGTAQ